MAVTRINNNQITTASNGNAYLGINAAAKLQNYSITSNKIANSLVYGSDLTVSGNLTVNGTTTTVDTVNTLIKDPILVLADGQTAGTPTVDIGILGYRGNSDSSFLGWQESGSTFMAILSNTTVSNTTVNVSSYANFTASTITAQGNLSVVGNIIGNANFSGNLAAGNILTPGLISATGNATAGNVLTAGLISATGNATAGNVLTAGLISATANITGGNILTAGLISATSTITSAANITGANILTGGLVSATANVTGGNILTAGLISATGDATAGNLLTGGLISATSNITGGNILTAGLISATSTITSAANITGANILTAGQVSATGNVNGGNVISAALVQGANLSATANVTTVNVLASGFVSAGGNVTSATNVNTPNVVGASGLTVSTGSGNINLSPTSGNIVVNSTYINGVAQPVQSNDVATKIYVDNMVSTQIAYHQAVTAATTANLATTTSGAITYNNGANGIGANITTTGSFNLIDTANVQTANTRILVKNEGNAALNGVYVWSNATVITRSTDADQYGPNSAEELSINDYFFVTSGDVNKGSAYIVDAPAGVITFGTSNIAFAQFSSSQTYTGGNGISLYGTVISTVYDNSTIGINGSNQLYIPANAPLTTPNIGAATGTSLSVTGAITAGTNLSSVGNTIAGNVTTVGLVSATGNVTGGNVLTAGLVSATANVTGGNILTVGIMSSTGNAIHGNILTAGLISATGNATAGNVLTAGLVSATANVTGGNILTVGLISATSTITSAANITGANILTVGLVSATGNVNGGNVISAALVQGANLSATANVTAVNALISGFVSATGDIYGSNLILSSGFIDGPASGRITINGSDADVDFAVDGDTLANVFYVDAGTGTASFGTSTQQTNAIVAFNAATSILLPVGNTGVRPSNASSSTGMVRFNTTLNSLEIYNNTQWTTVGGTTFTVIADEQFNGDGSTVAFTLATTQTTNSCIVSINGIVQIPGSAYSVAGTAPTCVLTFTEAPAVSDLIDVREITTTTSVTSVANNSGNAQIAGNATAAQMEITGNLVILPGGTIFAYDILNAGSNGAGNIGNATNTFNTIFAKSTSAQYADLAEKYVADDEYAPGTVVSFGGEKEVTKSTKDADRAVAGVISTNPSYIMNATLDAPIVAVVAFTGRVPTSVTGTVAKGDLMVSNGDGTARAEQDPKAGSIIGKALENFSGDAGVIEVVIGRF
jgi:hypothetical protein